VLADPGDPRAVAEAAFDGAAASRRFAAVVDAVAPVWLSTPAPAGRP
jgi:hypothetical protein